jgi:hypothetical protein
MKDRFKPNAATEELAREIVEGVRKMKESWADEWRSLEPEMDGEKFKFAEIIQGHLTGAGVKISPIYASESGKHLRVYLAKKSVSMQNQKRITINEKRTWVLPRDKEYDYFVQEFDLKEAQEKGWGKFQTTEEFLSV